MNNPIYKPKGRAAEYGEYAINIYTGCPHGCWYCFAPGVLRKDKERFHSDVRPRDGIVEAVRKQLASGGIKDKLIHLCFTCDPYPLGHDTSFTREIIQLIKQSGNHVQLLTKNNTVRDIDLLDGMDWYGISLTGIEETGANTQNARLAALSTARMYGIKTWVSFEPVIDHVKVWSYLHIVQADRVKIGKLNYHPSDIDWSDFGRKAEDVCKTRGLNYTIKDDLRAEMERSKANEYRESLCDI